MNKGKIDKTKLFTSPYTQDDQDLYLILKYQTNQKKQLGLDFSYGVSMMKIFGFDVSIDEIEDGFVLFYRTHEDYLISQIKNRSLKEIISLIKNRGLTTSQNIAVLKKNFKLLKT